MHIVFQLQVDEDFLLKKGKEIKTATFKLGPVRLYVWFNVLFLKSDLGMLSSGMTTMDILKEV